MSSAAEIFPAARDDCCVTVVESPLMRRGAGEVPQSAYSVPRVRDLMGRLMAESPLTALSGAEGERGPLARLIRPGDNVVLKPNWVSNRNYSGSGIECLVTHGTVVGAVVDAALQARPGRVVVGDAPIQSCNLPDLIVATGCDALKARYASAGAPVEWQDFRRTIREETAVLENARTGVRPVDDFVLFDLGRESLLEPIAHDAKLFRVTMYNPDLMRKTHAPGRHQYLISRHVMAADVVINLPKLKCHKKAGVTGALKNLVGINGNKDYLPHHRRGGSRSGGDCYEGGNLFKLASEMLTDAGNCREGAASRLLHALSTGSYRAARLMGADKNIEGSWYGNNTVWRMSLDLNRILLYGRVDGTMADEPQRKLLTITDAIVAGEGEGPLAPTPHPLGMLTLATNPLAAEFVHAHLMGFDWRKIPIIREGFGRFRYPISNFGPGEIEVRKDGLRQAQPWPVWNPRPFCPPEGWAGHCEL